MNTPQKRLKYFIQQRFGKIQEFCNLMGWSQQYLNKYINKGTSIITSGESIKKLYEIGLNYDWYKTGEGDMLLSIISNVGAVEEMKKVKVPVLPDLSKLTPEEMKALKNIMEDYLGKINQILEIVDERK